MALTPQAIHYQPQHRWSSCLQGDKLAPPSSCMIGYRNYPQCL